MSSISIISLFLFLLTLTGLTIVHVIQSGILQNVQRYIDSYMH